MGADHPLSFESGALERQGHGVFRGRTVVANTLGRRRRVQILKRQGASVTHVDISIRISSRWWNLSGGSWCLWDSLLLVDSC